MHRHILWTVVGLAVLMAAMAVVVSADEEPTVITYMHWGADPSYVERNERLIAEFERLNPDIKVERLQGGSGADYDEALMTRIAGGVAPDTFMVDLEDIPFFSELTLDLRPFVESDVDWGWDSIAAAARDIMTYDGKIVGTMDSISPNMWFYNADMVEEAGLEFPTMTWQRDAWTWDVFRDVSMKLHRVDPEGNVVVYGNAAGAGQALNRLFMWSNGAPEYDDPQNPTVNLYDSEEAIEAIRFIHRMQTMDEISLPHSDPSVNGKFPTGEVAMLARWSSGIARYGMDADFRFGVAPYPKGPSEGARYSSDVGASVFAISESTKNAEAAWRWVAFLGGRDAAPVFAEEGPGIPIHPGVEIRFFPDNYIYPEYTFDLLDLPDEGAQFRLMSKDAGSMNRIVDEGITRIMNNEVSIENGMAEIARLVNNFMEQNPQ